MFPDAQVRLFSAATYPVRTGVTFRNLQNQDAALVWESTYRNKLRLAADQSRF